MVPFPLIPVAFIILRLILRARGKSQPVVLPDPRRVLWVIVAVVAVTIFLPIGIGLLVAVSEGVTAGNALALLVFVAMAAGAFFAARSPWSLLHPLARRGHYRLVYYLAQLSPLFVGSGQTAAGGLLLSAIALAHRPASTGGERKFLDRRLARDKRGLGAFGSALALLDALSARAARDAGDLPLAFELEERARALFGTVTYLSPKAAPLPVRRIAEEYLALDSVRRGLWGGLENLPEPATRFWQRSILTPASQALRAYFRERLKGQPRAQEDEQILAKIESPIVAELFARAPAPPSGVDRVEARARANKAYLDLLHRRPVGPRLSIAMLATFDHLLDPASPATLLPPEVQQDPELCATLQDDVASTLAEVIAPVGLPFEAMPHFGPISARVHDRVETALFDDLTRNLKRLDARRADGVRLDARAEWFDVSLVRVSYRRLQFTLGNAAAGRIVQALAVSYGNLGVDMTAKPPFRRPLAHAIFNMLRGEAVLFGNQASITLQTNNMKATAGM